MATKCKTTFQFLLVLSLALNVNAQFFDITKYGAKGDGSSDSTKAIAEAWKAACASPNPSTLVVPKGIFMLTNAKFEGPCKAATGIQLQGTLRAPEDHTKQLKGVDWLSVYHVDQFTLNGGGIVDGAGSASWKKKLAKQTDFSLPTSLGLNFLTNAVVENIIIKDSKMFQVNVLSCKNITLQRLTVSAPYDSPNTDGIHIGRSSRVKVRDSKIMTGDDCVSIGDGNHKVHVRRVDCGPGHGIAIGSLGKYSNEESISQITIRQCTLTNTENGLRIKTWEDSPISYTVSKVRFEDITLTNVTYPINIDQEYCPSGNCAKVQTPSTIKIDGLIFKGIKGTSATSQIVKLQCSKSNPCSNVEMGDIDLTYNGPKPQGDVPVGSGTSICKNVQPRVNGRVNPPLCSTRL